MKFIEGETLKARLKSSPLTQEEGMRIIENVGAALTHAHKQGILHRDIKPSNVMISKDNQIYLTDFGLARIAAAGESTLSSDMMMGTPQYISPEQAMGKGKLDSGTDIYSFGVLIYELVVGQVPFSADTPYSIIHDHIYSPLPMPRSVNPKVPESVERVLLKALSKEREDRFEDVDSFIKEFKAATHGEPLAEYWTEGQAVAAGAAPLSQAATRGDSLSTLPPAQSQAVPKEKKKLGFRWWYAIPIAILLFFFLVIVGNILDNRNGQNAAAPTQPIQIAQADLPPDGGGVFSDGPLPNGPEPDSPRGKQPPGASVEEALQFVDENPEDPYAYLELAGAYYDVGHDEEARYAYGQAQELAGKNQDFFVIATEMFRQRDLWPMALDATLKALAYHDGGLPPRELISSLHQAAYHAAAFEGPMVEEILFSDFVFRNEQQNVPFAGLLAAQARFFIFEGDLAEAERLLSESMDSVRDFPVAVLVQAELLIELGELDEAREILRRLSRSDAPNIDSWVKIEAQKLLNQIGS
jgi:cytochrome c-type biogenesis protein CcmH/NrfG